MPDPVPPIIVAANGPKMAAVAGALRRRRELPRLAVGPPGRDRRGLGPRRGEVGNDAFVVTLEVPFEEAWLRADSKERQEVESLGVSRVMARWSSALGVDAIQRAAVWTETA